MWAWADFVGTIIILCVLWLIWWYHFREGREPRKIWTCVRWHGGGRLITPRPMTVSEAAQWIGQSVNAEVGHVDEPNAHIFYRPRNGA